MLRVWVGRHAQVAVEEHRTQFERITINSAQMGGLPCIRGLRIPVMTVSGGLQARTYDGIVAL